MLRKKVKAVLRKKVNGMLKNCKLCNQTKSYKYVRRATLLYHATDTYVYFPTWQWCFASWELPDDDFYYKEGWHYKGCYKTQAGAEKAAATYAIKHNAAVKIFHYSQLIFGYDGPF